MTTLLRNKAVMGTAFRIFESHIPYNLQFFIDYKIYGMGYVNFSAAKFRLPVPESRKRHHIDLNESVSRMASQGALCLDFHLASNIPESSYLYAKKDTLSELELDVDATHILESSGPISSPNTSGMDLPEQLVPSLTYMWEDECRRRYEAVKLQNPGISLSTHSLGLGSIFESSHERLVDGPHDFHQSILERFRKLVEKDESDAKSLFADTAPLFSQNATSSTPNSSNFSTQVYLNATPMATTRFKDLAARANRILKDELFIAASQQVIGSQVDEELASSQVSDESLLEALEWMHEDHWDNVEWESRIGREFDATMMGVPANNDEEEHIMDDRDVEAILASQREVCEQLAPDLVSDLIPPPEPRKKRDHEETIPTYEDILYEELMSKPKKRVQFVETTQILHFNETDLHPHTIEEIALRDISLSSPNPFGLPMEGIEMEIVSNSPANNQLPQISPPKHVSKIQMPSSGAQKSSSQDPNFQIDETQQFSSSNDSNPSPNVPVHVNPEIMNKEVLIISELTNLASHGSVSRFAKSFANRRAPPMIAPSPPFTHLGMLDQSQPHDVPMQSSGQILNTPSVEQKMLLSQTFPSLHTSEDSPEQSYSSNPIQMSSYEPNSSSMSRRSLVLKFNTPPPTWDVIVAGMKRRETPTIRYQAPFYGVPSDRPARTSKFAGISIPVESVQFDTLPPFNYPVPPNTAFLTHQYHEIGAKRQRVKKKGKQGLPLRALTPARPPPIVHLYDTSQILKEKKAEEVVILEEDEDDDYELVANSPKLAEQFRLVAAVRRPSSLKKGKNIQELLGDDNASKRRYPTFSQPDPVSLASQIDRAPPSNPHGFALQPEARRDLGGKGIEGLTMFSLEVFSTTNGSLRADPNICPVEGIYYCIRDDFEIRAVGAENYNDRLGVLYLKRGNTKFAPASFVADIERKEYDNEVEMLLGFRDLLVEVDPDIVMGYECQQNSLGYIFERAMRLNIPKYIPSFGRASGDIGNQFENSGDSWVYQHASGISMVGRIVFNVWRIMRSELALQSYSFESIVYHVLHQRIPHFDHITLTKWYTGLDNLGPSHVVKPKPTAQTAGFKGAPKRFSSSRSVFSLDGNELQPESSRKIEDLSSTQLKTDSQMNVMENDGPQVIEDKPKMASDNTLKDQLTESDLSKRLWPHAPNRWRVESYYLERAQCNFYLLDALNIISRTSEFARMYGITFYSVLSRGSQYRVESLMLRMTKPQNYVCVSPTRQQVAQQLAPESIPLVMEPLSAFYTDPVLVLDFQSLYPSVIIAYNLCFSTCLGKIGTPSDSLVSTISKRLGVINYDIPVGLVSSLKDQIYCSANGVMYVKPELRTGTMPRMLHEILTTRVMIKESMKAVKKKDPVAWSLLDSRQLGLKMIANVTYGYASASFSGRMPCIDLADSIVQTGRETLERAIKLINSTNEWGAKVVYGDTDSVFVQIKGATKERAFQVGNEIARRITDDNPWPIKLKFEKCYLPCVLLAKKRYVGYMYETVEQELPIFDAKGIETVRRDTCPAVSKILEKSLRMLFESKDLSLIKSYLRTQWTKILTERISLMDFIFRKEVRLGTYRGHHAPPAALVAMKELEKDPRAAPRYGERVPYLVVNGTPKSRLIDLVYHPSSVTPDSGMAINANYYITRNIIPVLARVFDLFGVSIANWYLEMPKKLRNVKFNHMKLPEAHMKMRRHTIDHFFTSQYCPICDTLTAKPICDQCQSKPAMSVFILSSRVKVKKRKMAQLLEICMQCSANPARQTSIDCDSLDCSVFYQRIKYASESEKISSYENLLRSWEDQFSI
jgi:DNA polymerase elongation subunit (family B)